ncbi:MAG: hypothetical protein SFU87_03865, partial [Chitinophagaceae bacterium]|nr:hypothetical protein [Chitinophagaceae bacterium]
MIRIFILLFNFLLVSCIDVSNTKMGEKIADSVQTDASQYVSTIDTTIWISNFRQFREAVYHRN